MITISLVLLAAALGTLIGILYAIASSRKPPAPQITNADVYEGTYLILDRRDERIKTVNVVYEAALVVELPDELYKPYVDVMNCKWLFRFPDKGE